jgi:BASS family bile acid:Na+ symporter
VQNILVGLALVAAMPIAGSSTAWSQNAEGNLALSLGLVVCSTLFSPFTTPLALHAVGGLAAGGYAARLHDLASHGTSGFLAACVVFPSVLGITLNHVLGHRLVHALRPWLKLANQVNLLVLCYSNAALSLPQTIAQPDPDFLAIIIALTAGLCLLAFGTGWGLGQLLRLDAGARISLMFGLGMNNNGTGLVLASLAFADSPRALLPIILYNLVQQIVAGAAISSSWAGRGSTGASGAERATLSAPLSNGFRGSRRIEDGQPNQVAGLPPVAIRPTPAWP